MSKEIWKDVKGYEGYYQVSNYGSVRSLKRKNRLSNKILKQQKSVFGYLRVHLCKNNKIKCVFVHRLVAMAFIENKQNKPQVNHINEIKTDNRLCNLEWVTAKENVNHGAAPKKRAKKRFIPVFKYDMNGRFIEKYESITIAAFNNNIHQSSIQNCLNKKSASCGGFQWSKMLVERIPPIKTKSHKQSERQRKKVILLSKTKTIFNSVKDASEKTGIPYTSISSCCRGERSHAGGEVFKYE